MQLITAEDIGDGLEFDNIAITTTTGELEDYIADGAIIPEPASLALVGLGSLLVVTGRRRRHA